MRFIDREYSCIENFQYIFCSKTMCQIYSFILFYIKYLKKIIDDEARWIFE